MQNKTHEVAPELEVRQQEGLRLVLDPFATTPRPLAQDLPAELIDVALVDADTAAAVGGASRTMWLAEVRAGRAPKPVVRRTRFTRWRLTEVRQFWLDFVATASDSGATRNQALKASIAAQSKRMARATGA